MWQRGLLGTLGIAAILLAACGSKGDPHNVSGIPGGTTSDGATGGATGLGGAGGNSTSSNVGGRSAAGAAGSASVCNHELGNPACWSSKDLTQLVKPAPGFAGAVFDGRFLYYVSTAAQFGAQVARFDTQGDFTGTTAWSVYHTASTKTGGYYAGAFDGRYLYLTPTQPKTNGAAATTYDAVAARYDTQVAFGNSDAWSEFNLTSASGAADLTVPGFQGAAFDGRYVYFAPMGVGDGTGSVAFSGKAARYDTQASFTTASAWATFEMTTVDPSASFFYGSVFDGRYVYYIPHNTVNARVARYDTRADFATASSWSTFETTRLHQYASGYSGAVFDGRYIYLVPAYSAQSSNSRSMMTRYDTQSDFAATASWTLFDHSLIGPSPAYGYSGGAFDGRFVYFIPWINPGPMLRYDTQAAFDSPTAWQAQSLYAFGSSHPAFSGAAFDGRYLYLIPTGSYDPALRFDARPAGPMPAAYKGSFY